MAPQLSWWSRLRNRLARTAALLLLVGAGAEAQAPTDLRVALVIGNSAYVSQPLPNPVNDARGMAAVFKALGYKVIVVEDATRESMRASISAAAEMLRGRKGIGVFYYAGHALQVDWQNYMVPVDARIRAPSDVQAQAVNVAAVLDEFKAAGNRMNIIVLDACRDNPFSSVASAKGLAQLDAPPGTYLAFATAPGNVAEDGAEGGNGLFTRFLLAEIVKPVARIEDVFKRVRLQVRRETQGRQIPWDSSSLEEDFFFNPTDRVPRVDPRAQWQAFEAARAEWERIQDTTDPAVVAAFLQRYPSSSLSEAAQFRLNQLERPSIQAAPAKNETGARDYQGERLRAGDEYLVEVRDRFTNVLAARTRLTVTGVTARAVELNNGDLRLSPLGSPVQDADGVYDPPLPYFPAEFSLGKSWYGVSHRKTAAGDVLETITGTHRIVRKETITVPAGTFETWVVQSRLARNLSRNPGYSFTMRAAEVETWIDPRYGVPIQQVEVMKDPMGIKVADRRQLAALKVAAR